MKVQIEERNLWVATGNGWIRPIIAEGKTRIDAMKAYGDIFAEQYAEDMANTAYSEMAAGTYGIQNYEDRRGV